MSEIRDQVTFRCDNELLLQIEAIQAEFKGKYDVNMQNLKKFSEVYDFFCGIADDDGGDVVCLDVHPESSLSSVSIEVSTVDLYKDTMAQFIDVLQYLDLLEVKPTTSDSLLISAGVSCVLEVVE